MRSIHIRWLFVIPFCIVVFTPLYARSSPYLVHVPFFVWFQFAVIGIGVAITGLVYLVEHRWIHHPAVEPETGPDATPLGQGDAG